MEIKSRGNQSPEDKESPIKLICNRYHLIQTLLHFLQVTASYALMLIFMNFNYFQCLAILIGLTVGYFVFGWVQRTTRNSNECCY